MVSRAVVLFGTLLAGPAATAHAAAPGALPSPRDTWARVRTSHFTLYGDATESKIKEIGLDLERLRAVLLLLKKTLTANSPVPTSVFVFKSRSALEPYLPLIGGKPRNLDGYFQPSTDGNYIALTAAWNSDPRPIVYHEYLHYFMRNNFPPQPLWYEEGIAEYYSTFRATSTEAQTGMIIHDHLERLRGGFLMPLDALFAVDTESPEYNEESKQGLFYAESWALVHYLMRGKPERTPQLGRFLTLLHQGRPRDEAFREAFQTDPASLLTELSNYTRENRFFYNRLKFSELAIPSDVRVERLGREEILCDLGDLLAHGTPDRLADAERHVQAVLDANASHAGALGEMGWIRMRQERHAEAQDFLRRAIAAGSGDFRVYFHQGRLIMESLSKELIEVGHPSASQRAGVEEARRAFRKSIELDADFPEAGAALGRTYLVEPGDRAGEGIPILEAAVRALPSRTDLAMDLAALYDRTGRSAEGQEALRAALGPEAEELLKRRRRGANFEGSIGEVNRLLEEGKDDEALEALERIVARSRDETRQVLEDQLKDLKRRVARNRSIRQYNDAIALANRHDLAGALAAFRGVAANAEDPEVLKAAQEQVRRLEPLVARQPTKRPSTKTQR